MPKVISISPYHRNDPRLIATDHLKLCYLSKILARNKDAKLEDYLMSIKRLETRARSSYSGNIDDIESEEFVEMMLLDGCFIIELLLVKLDDYEEEDPLLKTPWRVFAIALEMLMLENQIPFFVLESLFSLATATELVPNKNTRLSLIQHIVSLYKSLLPGVVYDAISTWEEEESAPPEFYHILHLLHSLVSPRKDQKYSLSKSKNIIRYKELMFEKLSKLWFISCYCILSTVGLMRSNETDGPLLLTNLKLVPCAARLGETGVKFKKKGKTAALLDVTFNNEILVIPALELNKTTIVVLRNLIVFEQCFIRVGNHVTAYALLLDSLIDKAEDVALLHRHGCIVNGLESDDAAAALFNKLCDGVAVDYRSFYLVPLLKNVNKHFNSKWNQWRAKWNRWIATLMNKYFSSPWTIVSLVGAIIVVVLTALQTVYTLLAYYHPLNLPTT